MRYSSIENSVYLLYNEIKADEEIQNKFRVISYIIYIYVNLITFVNVCVIQN